MNRKLRLVLFISFLLVCCFAWVYAHHADQSKGETKAKDKPSEEVFKELRDLGKKITERAQEVKVEEMPPLPHVDVVRRPTQEQIKDMLKRRGLTPADPAKTLDDLKSSAILVPVTLADQRAETFCLIYVHDPASCCYYNPAGDAGLWGWENGVKLKTWNDPQSAPEYSECGYPIFPFQVARVEAMVYNPAPCSILVSFDIEDFIWDHCSPYPGKVIYETEPFWWEHAGEWEYIGIDFDTTICVYDRFFVSWTFHNSMDFDPTLYCFEPAIEGQETCIVDIQCVEPPLPGCDTCIVNIDTMVVPPDTTYGHLDTTFGHWDYNPDVKYNWAPSLAYDISGWCERTYWSYGHYWEQGYWWDAVCDLPAYGFGWPGAVRIRAWGSTHDQNECPDSVYWWQKEAFEEYAPCGVPDFDQKQKEAIHPETDAPWDGPTATANCLWWMAAACMMDPFWNDSDGDGENWDPHEVPNLINMLAGYMNFGDCGVTPSQMDSGLAVLKMSYFC